MSSEHVLCIELMCGNNARTVSLIDYLVFIVCVLVYIATHMPHDESVLWTGCVHYILINTL